jgi:hypothetical protein
MTMSDAKTKRFRLSIVNAAEDVPRLIRAYGKACNGEFGLVLRPPEHRGVLVLIRKDGALMWKSGEADGRQRAKAVVQRAEDGSFRLMTLTGPHRGIGWNPYEKAGLRVGAEVTIAFEPADQFAHVVADALAAGDAPAVPTTTISTKDAVALVKTEQKAVPKPGPITLRGSWSGWLHCEDGKPRVELVRKLAAYGVLKLESGEAGWTWTIERAEKWFTKPGSDTGVTSTLVGAIEAGLARAMGLLGEACSVRDSRRRAAMDAEYAAVHPVAPAKEGKDPTERIREPKAKKEKATRGKRATKAAEPPAPRELSWEEQYDAAMASVGPGNWAALTELYSSPEDAETQAALKRWLDKYAKNAQDAKVLLDGRDNAGEAGIRVNAYDEIARRLRFERIARTGKKGARRRPATAALEAPDAAKDKALLDAFSAAIGAAMMVTDHGPID